MARNAEKAMTTLARWRAAQVQEAGGQRERRPYLASECNDLQQAEKWRLQIVREIAKKVAQIQNDMEEAVVASVPSEHNSPQEPSIRSQTVSLSPTRGTGSARQSPLKVASPPPASPIMLPPKNSSTASLLKYSESPKQSIKSARSTKTPSPTLSKLKSPKSPSTKSAQEMVVDVVAELEPRGQNISEHINELTDTIKELAQGEETSSLKMSKIDRIAKMSRELTDEANALRNSIKGLAQDIVRTKQEISGSEHDEDVNFPYHLFLIEIVVNKIHMKCECFDIDYNNLVISAQFLGKEPVILYDPSYGKIENFAKLNVGKSTLFAMTYDKICAIKELDILLQLTKQPPCSSCVTKIGETHMDYTKDFFTLREELCKKWFEQQPNDDIHCTTATPLSKNMYYLYCGEKGAHDTIGVIEVSLRMSFLGKEITTAFCASAKPETASFLLKGEDNGMTMYSCHKVEMDDRGKILLDEDVMTKRANTYISSRHVRRSESPMSQISSMYSSKQSSDRPIVYNYQDAVPGYDEIFTKMNANELKIRVPKRTKVERMGKYDTVQELCTCENIPDNTGEQIQFELPRDSPYGGTHTSNLKYTCTNVPIQRRDKDKKVINVTPTNCPVPIDVEKVLHPQKDVFILKIGKKLETKDKKTDLEIELVTPKLPSEKIIENTTAASQQCSSGDLKSVRTKKTKGKGKKGGKGKSGKQRKKGTGKGKKNK